MNVYDTANIGQVLADLRKRRKLARPEVARAVGVTSNYLGMVEAGKRTLSLTTLSKLAEVYEVPEAFITCLATKLPRPGGESYAFAKVLKAAQEAMLTAIDEDEDAKGKQK